jgi:hypothetical protein
VASGAQNFARYGGAHAPPVGTVVSTVEIKLTSHGQGSVIIDGREIQGVIRIQISAEPRTANRLILELAPERIRVSGVADVTHEGELPPDTCDGRESVGD